MFGEVCLCVADGDCDVVQRIDSVLCQSLSDQVSHGCCTKWLPRFFSVAQPTELDPLWFVPCTIGNFYKICGGLLAG